MNVRQVVALLGWISVLAAGWLLFIGRVEPSGLAWWMLAMFVVIAFFASTLSAVDLTTEKK
jgi:hypothetical protein